MPGGFTDAEMEAESKRLMADWAGWRPILVHLDSLLAWERPADPGIIFGVTTVFFLLFWYLDPSILTTLSALALIAALADFLMPTLAGQFLKMDTKSDKKWETICRSMAAKKLSAGAHGRCFLKLRVTQPKMFYAVTIPTLFVLAWIGNAVSNVLLSYFVFLVFLMVPGCSRRGWLDPITRLMPACCKKADSPKKD